MRLAFALLALIAAPALAQGPAQLDHVGVKDGLSQGSVNAIARDSRGFLWFGTEDGLNRWDGYAFQVHRSRPDDPWTLASNFVWGLHAGRRCLWVGTNGGGLSCHDRESGRFSTLRHDPGRPDSLPSDVVMAVLEEADGTVWAGTEAGLARISWDGRGPLAGAAVARLPPPDDAPAGQRAVRYLVREPGGPLWVATDAGLLALPPGASALAADTREGLAVGHLGVRGLHAAPDSMLVGTFRQGVIRIDRHDGSVTRHRARPDTPGALPSDTVITLSPDGAGGFWLGSELAVVRFDPRSGRFVPLLRSPRSGPALAGELGLPVAQPVLSSLVEPDGTAWFGTWGDGALRFDPRRERFQRLVHDPRHPEGLRPGRGRAITEDAEGGLWLGSFGGGIQRARTTPRGLSFDAVEMAGLDPAHRSVWALHASEDGTLWAGTDAGLLRVEKGRLVAREVPFPARFLRSLTPAHGGDLWVGSDSGLYRYRPVVGVVEHLVHDPVRPGSLRSDKAYAVSEQDGELWIGTWNGLARRRTGRPDLDLFVHDRSRPDRLPADLVWALHRDRQGRLWAGTSAGLVEVRSHGASATFALFGEAEGMPDAVVYCIAEDRAGRLWLSTNRGLAAFDPAARRVLRSFDEGDGLPAGEFSFGACHAGARELVFGGVRGFVRFDPEAVLELARRPPSVVLTGLQVQGRAVPVGAMSGRDRPLLTRPIEETSSLELTHRDGSLTLEFAALDFRAPGKNRYSFRLHGFDPDWSPPGPRRFATYTNLDPGDYVFQVRAAGADGAWNEQGTSLRIQVLPPFWRTTWFRAGVAAGLLGLALAVHGLRLRALLRRRRELEAEVRERTAELSASNQELARQHDELQLSRAQREELEAVFFHDVLNTSGALRGLLELLPMLGEKHREELQGRAHAVAQRLVEEIQAQRDLVDAERGSLQVRSEPVSPAELLEAQRGHYESHPLAAGKRIELRCPAASPLLSDRVLLGRCLGNLLKNALEATAAGGVVTLSYGEAPPTFQVHNPGEVPRQVQERIFQRSFSTKGGRGRGLGTYGVKLLVERYLGGQVGFASSAEEGTTFTLRLP